MHSWYPIPVLVAGFVLSTCTRRASEPSMPASEDQPEHRCCDYPTGPEEDEFVIFRDALRTVAVAPECEAAHVLFLRSGDSNLGDPAIASFAFRNLDERCTRRYVEAAEAARIVRAHSLPGEAEYRIALKFSSLEAMNDWVPYPECRQVDTAGLVDDWAVSFLSSSLRPSASEPTRASRCERIGTPAEVLFYDADRLAIVIWPECRSCLTSEAPPDPPLTDDGE